MKASVGDRLVVVTPVLGHAAREGRIVELRHADGSPPYVVAWSDTGEQSIYFPGNDSRLQHDEASGPEATSTPRTRAAEPAHVKTWSVTIYIYEQDPETDAHVVLHAEVDPPLQARGHAHRSEGDLDVPEVGDELAVARALRALAERLDQVADEDVDAVSQLSDPFDLFRR